MGVEGGPSFVNRESRGFRVETGNRIESRPELADQGRVEVAPDERALRRRRMAGVFSSLGSALLEAGLITDLEVHQGEDTHGYFRTESNPSTVLHVQGLAGRSDDNEMVVRVGYMDYDKLQKARRDAASRRIDPVVTQRDAFIGEQGGPMSVDYNHQLLLLAVGGLGPKRQQSPKR